MVAYDITRYNLANYTVTFVIAVNSKTTDDSRDKKRRH